MRPFGWLDIETSSACNRQCATCIRNSNPNRDEVADWFGPQSLLPMDVITAILDQAAAISPTCRVILSHFNEPLLDPRIVDIAALAKSYGLFNVACVTNGDLLTPQLASNLDQYLDRIVVSLYLPTGQRRERAKARIRSYFDRTRVQIKGHHVVVHWHPQARDKTYDPCTRLGRLIINHRGDYLLCCDDMVGHFGLGRFPDISLRDYWSGDARAKIIKTLSQVGGRREFSHCATCPR